MGHSKITTTLAVYVHLFPDDDASDDMAALDALGIERLRPQRDSDAPLDHAPCVTAA